MAPAAGWRLRREGLQIVKQRGPAAIVQNVLSSRLRQHHDLGTRSQDFIAVFATHREAGCKSGITTEASTTRMRAPSLLRNESSSKLIRFKHVCLWMFVDAGTWPCSRAAHLPHFKHTTTANSSRRLLDFIETHCNMQPWRPDIAT